MTTDGVCSELLFDNPAGFWNDVSDDAEVPESAGLSDEREVVCHCHASYRLYSVPEVPKGGLSWTAPNYSVSSQINVMVPSSYTADGVDPIMMPLMVRKAYTS